MEEEGSCNKNDVISSLHIVEKNLTSGFALQEVLGVHGQHGPMNMNTVRATTLNWLSWIMS